METPGQQPWKQARIQQQPKQQQWVEEDLQKEEGLGAELQALATTLVSMIPGKINNESLAKLAHRADNFHAGAIARCIDNWKLLTSDKWILEVVKGYKIEFSEKPIQTYIPRPLRMPENKQRDLDKALSELLEAGIIEQSDRDPTKGFVSTTFTTPKKDGSVRVILNLKELNEFVEVIHFKMDTIREAILLMSENCYFASIDFKHAYYSVLVNKPDRKYLYFIWKGEVYNFVALP